MPDPAAIARAAPKGIGVIYRHFGRPDAPDMAKKLASIARDRRQTLLIGSDPVLAERVGAAGVHWAERCLDTARAWRRKFPHRVMTIATHSPGAVRRAAALRPDAVFLSPIAASRSASGGKPLGFPRLAAMARSAPVPSIALGGLTTPLLAQRAMTDGVAGVASVDLFLGICGAAEDGA